MIYSGIMQRTCRFQKPGKKGMCTGATGRQIVRLFPLLLGAGRPRPKLTAASVCCGGRRAVSTCGGRLPLLPFPSARSIASAQRSLEEKWERRDGLCPPRRGAPKKWRNIVPVVGCNPPLRRGLEFVIRQPRRKTSVTKSYCSRSKICGDQRLVGQPKSECGPQLEFVSCGCCGLRGLLYGVGGTRRRGRADLNEQETVYQYHQ